MPAKAGIQEPGRGRRPGFPLLGMSALIPSLPQRPHNPPTPARGEGRLPEASEMAERGCGVRGVARNHGAAVQAAIVPARIAAGHCGLIGGGSRVVGALRSRLGPRAVDRNGQSTGGVAEQAEERRARDAGTSGRLSVTVACVLSIIRTQGRGRFGAPASRAPLVGAALSAHASGANAPRERGGVPAGAASSHSRRNRTLGLVVLSASNPHSASSCGSTAGSIPCGGRRESWILRSSRRMASGGAVAG
jgi:hypothetical protein